MKEAADAQSGLQHSERELAAKVAQSATAEEATVRRETELIRGRDNLLVKAAACAPCKSALNVQALICSLSIASQPDSIPVPNAAQAIDSDPLNQASKPYPVALTLYQPLSS